MKARPRRVENRVAEVLTEKFRAMGVDCLYERIPVLGREGPDLTWEKNNPLELAIDVKSRIATPKKLFELARITSPFWLWRGSHLDHQVVWRLYDLDLAIRIPFRHIGIVWCSSQVDDWLDHMSEWARPHNLIPALVLHRPSMPVTKSILITYEQDRKRLLENLARCLPAPETQEE